VVELERGDGWLGSRGQEVVGGEGAAALVLEPVQAGLPCVQAGLFLLMCVEVGGPLSGAQGEQLGGGQLEPQLDAGMG